MEIVRNHENIVIVVTSAAIIAGASVLLWKYVESNHRKHELSLKYSKSFQLLEIESTSLMLMVPSISTITLYEGKPNFAYLRQRLRDIVLANPWLEGRLDRDGKSGGILVRYNEEATEECYVETEDATISADMAYEELSKRVNKYTVSSGNDCLKFNQKLFQMTVIRISDGRFAILFSINHMIADGFTFYKLYGMLSEDQPVKALVAERCPDHMRLMAAKLNGNDTQNWLMSAGATVKLITTLLFSPSARSIFVTFNKGWIASQKTRHLKEFPQEANFVSTNDVLTSGLLNVVKCDVALMAINLRNRLPGVTDNMAGNYEALVAFQPADYAHPHLIRQSFSNASNLIRRVVSDSLPGFFRSMFSSVAVVSTWATFFSDVKIPGCTSVVHFPYFENKAIVFKDICIIYKPNDKDIALMSYARSFEKTDLNPMIVQRNNQS